MTGSSRTVATFTREGSASVRIPADTELHKSVDKACGVRTGVLLPCTIHREGSCARVREELAPIPRFQGAPYIEWSVSLVCRGSLTARSKKTTRIGENVAFAERVRPVVGKRETGELKEGDLLIFVFR